MSKKKNPSQQKTEVSKRKGSPNSITRRGVIIGGTTIAAGAAVVGITGGSVARRL